MDAVVEAGARKPRKSPSKNDRRMIRRPCVSQPLSSDHDGAWIVRPLGQVVWVPSTGAQRYIEIRRSATLALIDRPVVIA